MTRRRNPFPGVARVKDRHGRTRWRFRRGVIDCYLPGAYGSEEFRVAYEAALAGARPDGASVRSGDPYGSFGWLIEQYYRSPRWASLSAISRKNLMGQMERFRAEHGRRLVRDLRLTNVEALLRRKADTPAAANALLKMLRRLCRFAIRNNLITADPTAGAEPFTIRGGGFHTWTGAEIARYRDRHPSGTPARLALEMALYTGAARQDLARMGWQNVREGRVIYRRGKTDGAVNVPLHPDLAAELAHVPPDRLLFLTHGAGRPYKPETLANWFKDQAKAAGLPHCTLHGLRKAGATALAEAGATETEIAAYLGHKGTAQARTYTKAADTARLSDSAFRKLDAAGNVSNLAPRLDNPARKPPK